MSQTQTKLPLPVSQYQFAGDIIFSCNWNYKLSCHFFTTIRLTNYAKYHVGSIYRIINQNNYLLDAKIVAIKYCKLHELPDFTCYLDTGYSKYATIELFKKMYQAKNINWDTQLLSIILLEHLDWIKP